MKNIPGYLNEIWFCPDGEGDSLPACIPFGPGGDGARALLEPGSSCVLVFWASSCFEALTYYYEFMEYGKYTTNDAWDYEPYPQDWLQEQQEYLNAL